MVTRGSQLWSYMTENECLEDMPPNVEVVYRELEQKAPMTQRDLIEATNLPFRPVRDALERLKTCEAIEELVYSHGRLRLYLFEESLPESADQQSVKVA